MNLRNYLKNSLTNYFISLSSTVLVMSAQLCFTKTQRGRTMLVYDGFKYVVNRQSQKNTFWRCNRYVKYGCRAGAVTSKGDDKDQTIRLTHTHSHPKEKLQNELDFSYKSDEYFEVQKFNELEQNILDRCVQDS